MLKVGPALKGIGARLLELVDEPMPSIPGASLVPVHQVRLVNKPVDLVHDLVKMKIGPVPADLDAEQLKFDEHEVRDQPGEFHFAEDISSQSELLSVSV